MCCDLHPAHLHRSMTSWEARMNTPETLPKHAASRMPVIFVGHGSPMNAIEDNTYTRHLAEWAKRLPKPKAILAVSAHWLTPGSTQIDAQPTPPTIHDFGGFPDALFAVQYPAAGDETMAHTTLSLLQAQLPQVSLSHDWGLDHGSWSVLTHMYPDADIPVFQLSINYAEAGAYHYAIGRQLAALRDQGVLIFASGNITHNLRALDFQAVESPQASRAWAQEFDDAVWHAISNRNDAALIDYLSLGPAAKMRYRRRIITGHCFIYLVPQIRMSKCNKRIKVFRPAPSACAVCSSVRNVFILEIGE